MASPTDIVTYIGVPLAVLGVAPILYNTVITLTALSKVRRILRKSRLAGITRGDVINNVIEIEFPRFQITPLDREDDVEEYWSIYEYPSLIAGGSWTTFNWKMHTVGLKTQRIKYADELRQPQADVGFEELISYMLDLGAIPNAAGFKMLRTSGLWVPTGTALLLSPDRHEAVLTIAPLNDSDGHLSLAARWSRKWQMRPRSSLPPYWILVSGPDGKQLKLDSARAFNAQELVETDTLNDDLEQQVPAIMSDSGFVDTKDSGSDSEKDNATESERPDAVRCHITIDGLCDAIPEHLESKPSQHLNISHLEIRKMNSCITGVWFASAATALGASGQTVLWNYHIPEDILQFSRKDTIPCGVLVLLGLVEESATPDWATQYDDEAEKREGQMKRMRAESQATMREMSLSPAERAKAQQARFMKRHDDFMDEKRETARREAQRTDARVIEALQSPKWDNRLVAEHSLTWLKTHDHVATSYDFRRIVEVLLFRMIWDAAFAATLTEMLDSWKGWVDAGGMSKAHYMMLKQKQVDFAYAGLILSIIRSSVTAADGSLAMDLQESVRIWKRVRLG